MIKETQFIKQFQNIYETMSNYWISNIYCKIYITQVGSTRSKSPLCNKSETLFVVFGDFLLLLFLLFASMCLCM